MKYKIIDLTTLNDVNEKSLKCGYNRNLYFDVIANEMKDKMQYAPKEYGNWNEMKTKVILQPLMVHSHKSLEPCEDHMRCSVELGGIINGLILDVPMDTFNEL